MRIACIVEGHGEVRSVGVLIRRISPATQVLPPLRVHRGRIIRAGELERSIELAARKLGGGGGILVLLDADDDCAAEVAPALLRRACAVRPDVPCRVVMATREFEAWFLASLPSLAGRRGIPEGTTAPPDPEAIRDAKGWLSRSMSRPYHEPTDQPAFAAILDMDLAAHSARSFRKFKRDVEALLAGPR